MRARWGDGITRAVTHNGRPPQGAFWIDGKSVIYGRFDTTTATPIDALQRRQFYTLESNSQSTWRVYTVE